MSWVKLSTGILTDPDVVGRSDAAFRTYVNGLAYCGENLTDGAITAKGLRVIRAEAADELAAAGLWSPAGDGYTVRNYLAHQQSRAQVEQARLAGRERQSRRRHGVSNAVTTPVTHGVTTAVSHAVSHGEVTEQIQIPDADEITNPTTARGGVTALPVDNCGGAIA
jgi:hypothetical protein